MRTVADGALGDAEQLGHLGIALAAIHEQGQRRAQVGREIVQSRHRRGRLSWRRDGTFPSVEQLNEAVTGYDRLYGLRVRGVRRHRGARRGRCARGDQAADGTGARRAVCVARGVDGLAGDRGGGDRGGQDGNGHVEQHELPASDHTRDRARARAMRLHRGRTTWVWDVTFSDDEGRTCGVTRMTIAVRPLPDGG